MIASGPAYPDRSTCAQARPLRKYQLPCLEQARALLDRETPRASWTMWRPSSPEAWELCSAAAAVCQRLGYETHILTDQLCCRGPGAGSFLASIARTHGQEGRSPGLSGGRRNGGPSHRKGLGGRNQELALSAAEGISGMENALIFSPLGSDGTDGPTDAAASWTARPRAKLAQG